MTVAFQPILTIVGIIEGLSIWQGRQDFGVPKVRCFEKRSKYIDLSLDRLIDSLKNSNGNLSKLWKSVAIVFLVLINMVLPVIACVINVLIPLLLRILWATWGLAYLMARYSVLLTIPVLSYFYLGNQREAFITIGECGVEQFLHGEWILWFVVAKAVCYLYAKILSAVSFSVVGIKAKSNAASISPISVSVAPVIANRGSPTTVI